MSYTIYLDKQNVFECRLSIEGASLNKASARIILEHNNLNYLFNGRVDSTGKCVVDIPKMSTLFKEGDTGKIKLEVIAEDAYFQPWESGFDVDIARKVRVEGVRNASMKKPSIKVEIETPKSKEQRLVTEAVIKILESKKITPQNITRNKKLFRRVISEALKKTSYEHKPNDIISEVVRKLAN